jgi:hypothetical protein
MQCELVAALAIACLGPGCYAPAVRDCTVSCGSAGDCATGQVCGADGMCASPAAAGQCARLAPDAGIPDAPAAPGRDAGAPIDAPPDAPPRDAGPSVRLTVQIAGKGSVAIDGVGTCSSQDPPKPCGFDVAAAAQLTLQAAGLDGDQFAMWTSLACAGQGARCTLTPIVPTTVSARFAKGAGPGVGPGAE